VRAANQHTAATHARHAEHLIQPAEAIIVSDQAFRAELGQHLARLWRYGLLLSRNRHVAEDLVQATCVRALERAGEHLAGARMKQWLLSILHSIWLNGLRPRAVRQTLESVDTDAYATQPHVMTIQVIRRVDALPETQRETIYLAYVEGFSYGDIAEILQVPVSTVMSRLATARLKLAEYPPLQTVPKATEGER